jgi:hypothetical protein
LAGLVLMHTKVDQPEKLASYVHIIKDADPGYLSDTGLVLHL